MYLKDGREIYESDKFPGYFVDANTGTFCDEEGNYIGGNQDNGDKPGGREFMGHTTTEYVWITATGKQYYPKRNRSASFPITLSEARKKGLKPSAGYVSFKHKEQKKQYK